MIQITLRFKPSYDLMDLSSEFPSITISNWCNFIVDFYELRGSKPDEVRSATRKLLSLRRKRGFGLQKKVHIGNNVAALILRCNHEKRGSFEGTMNKFHAVILHPFVFRGGWLRITAICFDENRLSAMLSRLSKFGELRVEEKTKINLNSLRENFIIPTRAIVSNLTMKQASAILSAVDLGYYKVPRLARFEDISKKLGVPRTTYEEHVRKAESKIINSVSPYLSVYFGRSGKKS